MSSSSSCEPSGHIFSRTTQALVYNFKAVSVQRMLDFDFLCKRETPSVAALISPGSAGGFQKFFFGGQEIAIPLYPSTRAAAEANPSADVFVNFASFRSAYASASEALDVDTLRTIVIIAEGVPENDARRLITKSKRLGKVVIGPATVGGLQAGAFKIGDTAGEPENIVACKLYRPGSVGFVSKSGGLSNEMYNILARTTDGLFEGIAIGGDVYPGSTVVDHLIRFERIPQIKMLVVLGEIGGTVEYEIIEAKKSGKLTKPICAWVSGTVSKMFPTEVQFGHAGAKSGDDERTTADAKNTALRAAGVHVPSSFEGLADVIRGVYDGLVAEGKIIPAVDFEPPKMPLDLKKAVKQGLVRIPTHIVSTISDDRGEEPTYCGVPISKVVEGDAGIGDVIGLLWFKKQLPRFAAKFIEMCVVLTADHGPCVSGAHNTIVAARAGKDLMSCVASGILTIGPRFGGAIDDAARGFKEAIEKKLSAPEFVEAMKAKGKRISGIGHRIKNADNPDHRVTLLENFARKSFPSTKFLDYAREVEAYTLQKSPNLILNVDGCIGALFLDLLCSTGLFTAEETNEIIDIGYLNGLFVLARSVGLIGHALDQKRLKQPLYRHDMDDVLYWQ